jgi:hypothetical protein
LVLPAGPLGSSRDSIESVPSGAIQMVSEGTAQFGRFVAPISILEAPYIWRDVGHMRRGGCARIRRRPRFPVGRCSVVRTMGCGGLSR